MKVTIDEFKSALAILEDEWLETIDSVWRRMAYAGFIASKSTEIDAFLGSYAKDGLIDIDAIEAIVDAAMKQCKEDHFEIPVNVPPEYAVFSLYPFKVKMSRAEVKRFFNQTLPSISTGKSQN